jgi:hypothetical protein
MNTLLYFGTLVLGNNNSLGSGTVVLTSGNIQAAGGAITLSNPLQISQNANVQFSGSQNLIFTGNLTPLGVGGTTQTFINTNSATVTFAGGINVGAQTPNMTFGGTGTTVLTGNSTLNSTWNVNGGTLVLAGASGATAATGINIGNGATFLIDNTVAAKSNRLFNDPGVTLNGGTFTIQGNATTAVSENGGANPLTLAGGGLSFYKSITNGSAVSVLFGSLTRAPGSGATIDFTDTGSATTLGTTGGTGNTLQFLTPPTLTPAAPDPNAILPYATYNGHSDWATYFDGQKLHCRLHRQRRHVHGDGE